MVRRSVTPYGHPMSPSSTFVPAAVDALAVEASAGEPSGGIAGWATGLMDSLGAPGAGLAVALENLFPPIPSEVVLPLAGFASSRGDMQLLAAIVWTTLGSVVGALTLYLAGAWLGLDRTRALAARLPLVDVSDVERSEAWFERYGGVAVLVGRMIPLVRSFVSVPAGVARMPLPVFVLYTLVGSLLWNTTFVLAGYLLGESWTDVERYVGPVSRAVGVALVVLALLFVAGRLRARRRKDAPWGGR
jgi:membrane protein DedA with SNARE-associated domain